MYYESTHHKVGKHVRHVRVVPCVIPHGAQEHRTFPPCDSQFVSCSHITSSKMCTRMCRRHPTRDQEMVQNSKTGSLNCPGAACSHHGSTDSTSSQDTTSLTRAPRKNVRRTMKIRALHHELVGRIALCIETCLEAL